MDDRLHLRLRNINERHRRLRQELAEAGRETADLLKQYLQQRGLTATTWCRQAGQSSEELQFALDREDAEALQPFLQAALEESPPPFPARPRESRHHLDDVARHRLLKAVTAEDAETVWSAVNYTVRIRFKTIQQFCDALSQNGFAVKYHSFRTEKYNRKLGPALKYANYLLEYLDNDRKFDK